MTILNNVDLLPLGRRWTGVALAFLSVAITKAGIAQDYFQGTCVYRVMARSNMEELSDTDIHKVLAIGDLLTVIIKDGNYKLSTRYAETYILKDDHREYIKFPKIDTVFFLDFSSDTDRVTGIIRSDSIVKMGGYLCKAITIETSKVSRRYLYSTTMRTNPEDDRNNTLEQAGVYAAETGGGIKLWIHTDYQYATEVDSCIRIERKKVPDAVFRLPDFPISGLFTAPRIIFPRFPGGDSGWKAFLGATVNPRLAEKYVKLPKGENEAWETVILEFAVAEDGTVSRVVVVNPKEVDPRLAAEALRVMRRSPKWVPASFFGEKVKWTGREGIEFSVKR